MVFYPKPGTIKELVCEFGFDVAAAAIIGTVVAVTGGSLAFAVNGTAVALAQGAVTLALMLVAPYVLFDPVRVLFMVVNDIICWARGKERPLYILRYIVTLIIQLVAAIVAALITWIYVPSGGPIHLGLTRVPAAVDDVRAFFALTVSSCFLFIMWLVVSENSTPLYRYGMKKLRIRYEEATKEESKDARKNFHPGIGQLHLSVATGMRALVVAAITIAITYATQPIAGYTTNPMMWLGYAIVSNQYDSNWWVPFVAPFFGGFIAYLLYLGYTVGSTWAPLTRYYGRRGFSFPGNPKRK